MKNKILHNHEADPAMYEAFYKTATLKRCFGRYKDDYVLGKSKFVEDVAEK